VRCVPWLRGIKYRKPTLVGGYGQTLRNLFGGDTRNVTVGVAIAFPFKNKTAKRTLPARGFRRSSCRRR
jgi:hypothetical protein